MAEPLQVTAGDGWSWEASYAGYPATDYALTYYLSKDGAAPKTITAAADHSVTVAGTITGTFEPGTYSWTACATKAGVRTTVGQGFLQVLPDPASTFDRRSHNAKMLAILTAAIEASDGLVVEYEIDGVRVKKDIAAARAARAKHLAAVRMERGEPIRPVAVRFTRV